MKCVFSIGLAISVLPIFLGCGSGNASNAVTVSAQSTVTPSVPKGEPVSSRDFANWNRFPVGTKIITKSVTERGPNQTISTITDRLIEKTSEKVVVERQNTTERSDGSLKEVNPPTSRTYNKTFFPPSGMKADDFQKPTIKSVRSEKTESIEVLGKTYEATLFTWTDSTESGPMKVMRWESDEMPGLMLKETMSVDKIETKTTVTVVELSIPKS